METKIPTFEDFACHWRYLQHRLDTLITLFGREAEKKFAGLHLEGEDARDARVLIEDTRNRLELLFTLKPKPKGRKAKPIEGEDG